MLDFLIFYEVKNREFESIVLLGDELRKRGYSVDYFSFFEYDNVEKRKKFFNKVKIAVVPSLYNDYELLSAIYAVTGKVKNIVNLRWEQVFQIWRDQKFDSYVYPKEHAKLAYHFCWGAHAFNRLRESGISEKNLFVTGPLQMDVLRPEFREYYQTKDELFDKYQISKTKQCILFISSFASSSMSKEVLENSIIEFPEDEKEHSRKWHSMEKKTRDTILDWLKKLSVEKDCTIIYRPHPSETNTVEVSNLEKYNNIRVIRDENVKQWILTCDQVYTWFSTSIAEAYFAGTQCAVLRPVIMDPIEEYSIYQDIDFITSYEKFSKYYDNFDSKSDSSMLNKITMKQNYDFDKILPSYIRCADGLEKTYKDDYQFPWSKFSGIKLLWNRFYYIKEDLKCSVARYVIKNGKLKKSKLYKKSKNIINLIAQGKKDVISQNEFEILRKKFNGILEK